jgi:hypothetical protein
MATKNIVPRTGSDGGKIGTASKHWSEGHFDTIDISGSSRFGNELTDTHVFTGSFHQTGSGATSYFKDTIDIEGNLTASGHVKAMEGVFDAVSVFSNSTIITNSGYAGVIKDKDAVSRIVYVPASSGGGKLSLKDDTGTTRIAISSSSPHIQVTGDISASINISASAFYGDGTGITGVTGDWDGQHDGDAGITGSLEVLGQISASLGITGSEVHTDNAHVTNLSVSVIKEPAGNIEATLAPGVISVRNDLTVGINADPDVLVVDRSEAKVGVNYNIADLPDAHFSVSGSTKLGDQSTDLLQVTGTVNIEGNLSASINISASAFYGDGQHLDNVAGTPGGSTTEIQYNGNGTFSGSSTFIYHTSSTRCQIELGAIGGMHTPGYAGLNTGGPNGAEIFLQKAGVRKTKIWADGASTSLSGANEVRLYSNEDMVFNAAAAERMRITTAGNVQIEGQLYNSGEDNGIKSANFIIDWDTGMTQEVILSASIATTLSASFDNIKPYATYQLIKKTGKDNMELYFDQSIYWPGGIRPSLSNISGSRDIITFTTDGDSNIYGTAQFDYSASVG